MSKQMKDNAQVVWLLLLEITGPAVLLLLVLLGIQMLWGWF